LQILISESFSDVIDRIPLSYQQVAANQESGVGLFLCLVGANMNNTTSSLYLLVDAQGVFMGLG
jgi:hypothetical protein